MSGAGRPTVYRDVEEMPEGTPFEFYYRGKTIKATRFASDGKNRTYGCPNVALNGEYGRAILADALGRTLEDAMANLRAFETEAQRQTRLAHQRDKNALIKEAMAAKSKRARKARW